jgi:hypothetical protein
MNRIFAEQKQTRQRTLRIRLHTEMDPEIRTQCVKAEYLRKVYGEGIDLRQWLTNPRNLYAGRHGRIFINKVIFHYVDSKWMNPYVVGTKPGQYGLNDSLNLYWQHLHMSGLISQIGELKGCVLGCFCESASTTGENTIDCHTKILVHAYKNRPQQAVVPVVAQPAIARGKVYVGRRIYTGSKFTDPTLPGCYPVVVMTASTKYGSLSPYELRDPKGRIVECAYQFSKIYSTVPKTCERVSRWDHTVIWEWPEQEHARYVNGQLQILPAYLQWRQAGMAVQKPIRYPVGRKARSECIGALGENPDGSLNPQILSYIEARKKIYVPLYSEAVVKQPQFKELQQRVAAGQNLLIIEVDAAHQESLPYYIQKYGVRADFIVNECILAEPVGLEILLNDPTHNFGHGFVLSALLM